MVLKCFVKEMQKFVSIYMYKSKEGITVTAKEKVRKKCFQKFDQN